MHVYKRTTSIENKETILFWCGRYSNEINDKKYFTSIDDVLVNCNPTCPKCIGEIIPSLLLASELFSGECY